MLAICHSAYSFQAGVHYPQQWAEAAYYRGYKALALADLDGLYGAVNFFTTVREYGIWPIIGASVQFGGPFSFIAFVMNEEGYRQLCSLLTRRHIHPEESPDFLLEHEAHSGLLFLTHLYPAFNLLAEWVPSRRLYLLPPQQAARPGASLQSGQLWEKVKQNTKYSIAPIPDAWFIDEKDSEVFQYRQEISRLANGDGAVPLYPGACLPDSKQWCQQYPRASRVMEGIINACTFEFDFNRLLLPEVPHAGQQSSQERLRALCVDGWRGKYRGGQRDGDAWERLEKELSVICHNGFADYFLYVYDIMNFADRQHIPVGVRGSAASSIVSYLLNFTACCPLEYNLYFERFMNPGRTDCPDIDIDIADTRRDEVVAYCCRRWGPSHVAMIANLQTYQTRSAWRDAARILQLPPEYGQDEANVQLPSWKREKLTRIASALKGLPRHLGLHCGGIVITPSPVTDFAPLYPSGKGVLMTHYEKDQAEAIGLVKMDLLGNSALSVIDQTLHWIRTRKRNITLGQCVPRYDFKINRALAGGDTLGVYQCESPGMRQLCRAVKPTTPKEVAATLSLIRPGPASAGMKEAFIRRRRKQEPITYPHPRMADFLRNTYGVMLYQEDVMQAAVSLAGYSMAEADSLRSSLSKKKGATPVENEYSQFVTRKAAATGLPRETAEHVWQHIARFASYAYCKAHASVYGRLAWITAFLKTHYAEEFTAATLNCHKSMYPPRVFVWDAIRHGVPVLPPDVCNSTLDWRPTGRGVRAGLRIIKGVRHEVLYQIISERRKRPFASFRDLQQRVSCRAEELVNLVLAGACRRFNDRRNLLHELKMKGRAGQYRSLFRGYPDSSQELPPVHYTELALTDIPFTAHPIPSDLSSVTCRADQVAGFLQRDVQMAGIMDAYKVTRTEGKNNSAGRRMSFVTLEDESGMFEVVVFPDIHDKYSHLFTHVGPFFVKGRITLQWDSIVVEALEISSRK